jgi:hypothetical protein
MNTPENRFTPGLQTRLEVKFDELRCSICGQALSLETAKADEYGRPIHEDCYASKIKLKSDSDAA